MMSPTTTMLVTYRGTAADRFDRHYYVDHHLPLVTRSWQRHGLRSVDAYFDTAVGDTESVVAICLCHFDSESAVARALEAPESGAVMEDVAAFTDITPARTVMTRA